MDGIGSSASVPSITKTGQIKSLGDSTFSRTIDRSAAVARKRRRRVVGNGGDAENVMERAFQVTPIGWHGKARITSLGIVVTHS
jgi:hypothetical protein